MATRVVCPNCQRTGTSARPLTAGMKVRCPSCKNSFIYADPPNVSPAGNSPPALPGSAGSNPLAIASLTLGILAALICWVPFVGLLSIPSGILSVLLASFGIAYALFTKRTGLTTSLVAGGISIGSILLACSVTGAFTRSIGGALTTRAPNAPPPGGVRAVAQKPPMPGRKAPANRAGNPGIPPVAQVPNQAAIPPQAGPDKAEEWVEVPASTRLGEVEAKVISTQIKYVKLKDVIGDENESSELHIVISIRVNNLSSTKKIDYSSWAGRDIFLGDDTAHLSDNLGNVYRPITFGYFDEIVGQIREASIYPNKTLVDHLVFEVPVEGVQHLQLEMPGGNVGAEGKFKFRIPDSSIIRWPSRGPTRTTSPKDRPLQPFDRGILISGDITINQKPGICLARSDDAWYGMVAAKKTLNSSSDNRSLMGLIYSQEVAVVPEGTPAMIVETAIFSVKVRVIAGDMAGVEGWVENEHFKRQ